MAGGLLASWYVNHRRFYLAVGVTFPADSGDFDALAVTTIVPSSSSSESSVMWTHVTKISCLHWPLMLTACESMCTCIEMNGIKCTSYFKNFAHLSSFRSVKSLIILQSQKQDYSTNFQKWDTIGDFISIKFGLYDGTLCTQQEEPFYVNALHAHQKKPFYINALYAHQRSYLCLTNKIFSIIILYFLYYYIVA